MKTTDGVESAEEAAEPDLGGHSLALVAFIVAAAISLRCWVCWALR